MPKIVRVPKPKVNKAYEREYAVKLVRAIKQTEREFKQLMRENDDAFRNDSLDDVET